jgi:hypothetical protein
MFLFFPLDTQSKSKASVVCLLPYSLVSWHDAWLPLFIKAVETIAKQQNLLSTKSIAFIDIPVASSSQGKLKKNTSFW